WRPPADVRKTSRIGDYMSFLERTRGLAFDDYDALWQWSVTDLPAFWASIRDYFERVEHTPATEVLSQPQMAGTRWFRGATVNYAEHVLRAPGLAADDPVVLAYSQSRPPLTLNIGELRDQVRRVRAGLRRLGIGRG